MGPHKEGAAVEEEGEEQGRPMRLDTATSSAMESGATTSIPPWAWGGTGTTT